MLVRGAAHGSLGVWMKTGEAWVVNRMLNFVFISTPVCPSSGRDWWSRPVGVACGG